MDGPTVPAPDALWDDIRDDEFGDRWRALAAAADSRDPDTGGPDTPWDDHPLRDRCGTPELAVVEQDLPGTLFGFTRRESGHVTVNRNLYEVDKERTIRHEKTHHRHPKDELTIRYINGDIDVRNTLSFQANNAARIGNGAGRASARPAGTAAYGAADDERSTAYDDPY